MKYQDILDPALGSENSNQNPDLPRSIGHEVEVRFKC